MIKHNVFIFCGFLLFFFIISCGERELPVFETKLTSPNTSIVIQASGDTMLARRVMRTIQTKGYKYPFQKIKPTIEQADLMFTNLETVITENGKLRDPDGRVNYVTPPFIMDTLLYSGIDAISIANNHIYDAGSDGVSGAIELLSQTDLLYGGAGINDKQASQPTIVEINGIKTAILYYTGVGLAFKAGRNKSGYNPMEYTKRNQYIRRLSRDLKKIRQDNHLVILSIHWGKNFSFLTTDEQIRFAHDVLDMGVDIILGHGAHYFHGIEIYKGKPIIYDMGDFLNDYSEKDDFSKITFIFKLIIEGNTVDKIELIPTSSFNHQIEPVKGAKAQKVLGKMIELSERFDTDISIQGDTGIIDID